MEMKISFGAGTNQGDGRLLTNLETREANKQDGRPKKISVRQVEDMLS